MNFLANARASMNPSATNIISQISSKSGTTIAHGLETGEKTVQNKCRTFLDCRSSKEQEQSAANISEDLRGLEFRGYMQNIKPTLQGVPGDSRGIGTR